MGKKEYNTVAMITAVCIILIFQLIDMLSCGPMIFYSSTATELGKKFSTNEIDVLKKLGCVIYIYSCIISMVSFAILSKIDATVVSGIVIESLRPMVDSFAGNILEEAQTVNAFFTNLLLHVIVTTLGFSLMSLFLFYLNKAHCLALIPKSVINGCLGAIGLGQMAISLDCIDFQLTDLLDPSSQKTLFIVLFLAVAGYFILEIWFKDLDFLIPAYFTFLIVCFYAVSPFIYGKSNFFGNLRAKNWIDHCEALIYPNFVLNRLEISSISLKILGKNILKILSMVFISSIHIAVNLPAFKMATGVEFDFSTELKTQGLCNIFTFVPCYFIVSYSTAVYKSGGNKRLYSLIAGGCMVFLALYGVMIKGYIPKFALGLVPGIMFIGFFMSSFYDTLFYISAYEYILSAIVCIIIKAGSEIKAWPWFTDYSYPIGLVAGFFFYILLFSIFILFSKKRIAKAQKIQNIPKRTDVLTVDYNLWFYTTPRFENELKTKNSDNIILDFQKCSAIDWIGQDKLVQICEKFEKVTFIGDPFNLRHSRFSHKDNFFRFLTYQSYLESLQM